MISSYEVNTLFDGQVDTSKNHCTGAGSGNVAQSGDLWSAGTATTAA